MCVIFWSLDQPDYDLIIASNRDEFLARPTLPAVWHRFSAANEPGSTSSTPSKACPVLSARDASGGGTWLGVTRNGAFSTLTNFTEASPPLPEGLASFRSRGELVRDWLLAASRDVVSGANRSEADGPSSREEQRIRSFLGEIGPTLDQYPGFNLLIGSLGSERAAMGYVTNRTPSGEVLVGRDPDLFFSSPVARGGDQSHETAQRDAACLESPESSPKSRAEVVGMSNSVLQDAWTKVQSGRGLFSSAIERQAAAMQPNSGASKQVAEERLVEDLFDLLWTSSDPPPRSRAELRNSVLITPVLSPNAKGPEWYGTRTSTVLLIRKATELGSRKTATFVERDVYKLDDDGQPIRLSGSEGQAGRNGSQRRFDWDLEDL